MRFKGLPKDKFVSDLKLRVEYPENIDQDLTPLCGPATFFYSLAKKRPELYARYVIDISLYGEALINTFQVKPRESFFNTLPSSGIIAPVDWIALGSLRDSGNPFLPFNAPTALAAGITTPAEMALWFKQVGFQQITNKTLFNIDLKNLAEAQTYHSQDYTVCLLVNDGLLKALPAETKLGIPTHWTVLTYNILLNGQMLTAANAQKLTKTSSPTSSSFKYTLFTWGAKYQYQTDKDKFLKLYHGFISAKWP